MEAAWFALLVCSLLTLGRGYDLDPGVDLPTRRPLNIAHRGSSGMFPDHTAEGYRKAIEQGADIIECDVTVTRDLQLVCLHESWMNATTNVAQLFPDRWTTREIDGEVHQDYFSVDFTLVELKQLRVRQRFPFRDHNYDLLLQITTLEEYIKIAKSAGRPVGIYPESKEPDWVNSLDIVKNANTTLEDLMVNVLHKYGYTKKTDPCFIQSFSEASLLHLSRITDIPLIRLYEGGPITNLMLKEWARYCYGVSPHKRLIVEVNPKTNYIVSRTDLVSRAHVHGLFVHTFTFRNEPQYLAHDYGLDPHAEFEDLVGMGVDGLFTDFPASLTRFLESTDRGHNTCAMHTSNIEVEKNDKGLMLVTSIVMTLVWCKGFVVKRDLNDFILFTSLVMALMWLKGLVAERF